MGPLSEKAGKELGLPAGIAVGSGVIDAYAGWIGTVGAKVDLAGASTGDASPAANDVSQAFTRLAAVAGTSTCHLAMSREAVFVNGVWGPYRDVLIPGFWMAEGGQSATGELLRHTLETHPAHAQAAAEAAEQGKNIYDSLNGRLRALARQAAWYITLRVYSASTQQNNENEKRINKSEGKKESKARKIRSCRRAISVLR